MKHRVVVSRTLAASDLTNHTNTNAHDIIRPPHHVTTSTLRLLPRTCSTSLALFLHMIEPFVAITSSSSRSSRGSLPSALPSSSVPPSSPLLPPLPPHFAFSSRPSCRGGSGQGKRWKISGRWEREAKVKDKATQK
jgi:hypothetical protein